MSSIANICVSGSDFLVTKGICALINAMPAYKLVGLGEASLYEQVTTAPAKPDLLIAVIERGSSGLYAQLESIIRTTTTKVLLVLGDLEKDAIHKIKKIGINGIITKQCSKEEITNAISTTLHGQPFMCGKVLDVLFSDKDPENEPQADVSLLSKRELEVLALITQQHTTSEIAELLNLSVHTINSHRKNILKKLNLRSPIELIVYALEHKLTEKTK